MHVSRELYRAVVQGELSKSFLEEATTEHLLARCPHCRAEAAAYTRERQAGSSAWSRVLRMFVLLAERLLAPSVREQRRAQGDLQEILSLPMEAHETRIARSRTRFRSPAFVRLLLDESRRHIPRHPAEAFHFAALARSAVNRNPRMPGYFDLYALSTAVMANARRLQDDSRDADQLFTLARQIMDRHGVTDPAVIARVDDLMGSLRRDQRRFQEAERLQKRAATLFSLRRLPEDAARALINLGAVYKHLNDGERAIDTTRAALGLLGPEADPRLLLCGHYNLALYLAEAGRYDEAADQLEADAFLYRQFGEPWTQRRLDWLQGDIATGRGDVATAEQLYLRTRDGFIAEKAGYDAAIVSLDLAVLYLKEERTCDVQRLAEEMLPIFQAQDIHREALAALRLFQEAARRQELTVDKALQVATYLKEARTEPGRRFAWAGSRSRERG